MNNEQRSPIERPIELKENRGCNTKIGFTFVRHSQKVSGRVFNEGNQGLSMSNISEAGKKRAESYGKNQFINRIINKAYATESDRTKETLISLFKAAEINPQILQKSETMQAFFSLPAFSASKEFINKYDGIMLPKRQQYINEHYFGKKFDELTPDEQETAAEYSEESAIEWYLSFDANRPDTETPSPKEQAASVAFKINRLVHLADYMSDGKSIELVSSGHKTSTEAFLKYVIEQEKDGEIVVGFDSLEEIGGSLKILDSWNLQVQNDNHGKKHVSILLRRENGKMKEYRINVAALNELAKMHIIASNINPKKIDSLLVA